MDIEANKADVSDKAPEDLMPTKWMLSLRVLMQQLWSEAYAAGQADMKAKVVKVAEDFYGNDPLATDSELNAGVNLAREIEKL